MEVNEANMDRLNFRGKPGEEVEPVLMRNGKKMDVSVARGVIAASYSKTQILNNMESTERKKKVTQAVEWVGLKDKINSKPADMSGGECQRTAIARAIVHEPALLLADEPTANLDAENSHNIMKILSKLNSEISTSFVFATHDEKIMGYLRRIVHLEDGKIINDEKISNPKSA